MTFEDLKEYYANDPKEYSEIEKQFIITLGYMVKDGKLDAFLSSDKKVFYKYKSDMK